MSFLRDTTHKLIIEKGRCTYCGISATERDHVVPLSFQRAGKRIAQSRTFRDQPDNIVPCCRECNAIASDKVFSSIFEKRSYIKHRLKQKYKKLLQSPNWSQSEIDEMGPKMKRYILVSIAAKQLTIVRVSWPEIDYDLKAFSREVFNKLFKNYDR